MKMKQGVSQNLSSRQIVSQQIDIWPVWYSRIKFKSISHITPNLVQLFLNNIDLLQIESMYECLWHLLGIIFSPKLFVHPLANNGPCPRRNKPHCTVLKNENSRIIFPTVSAIFDRYIPVSRVTNSLSFHSSFLD